MQEYLLTQPHDAMRVVSGFLGLSPFKWEGVNITAHSSAPKGPTANEKIPLEQQWMDRLRAIFSRHGTQHWDKVHEHGYHGCRPDV